MNVFLACFVAMIFAKIFIAAVEATILPAYVRWRLRRIGVNMNRRGQGPPMPAPPAAVMHTQHGRVELPGMECNLTQQDIICLVLDLGEAATKVVADVPDGGTRRVSFNEIDPGNAIMTEIIHTSIAMWRITPPTWVAHMRRMKAERDKIEVAATEAAGSGRIA